MAAKCITANCQGSSSMYADRPITPMAEASVIMSAKANLATRSRVRDSGSRPISQSCWPSSEISGNTNRLVNVARIKLTAAKFRNEISSCVCGVAKFVFSCGMLTTYRANNPKRMANCDHCSGSRKNVRVSFRAIRRSGLGR